MTMTFEQATLRRAHIDSIKKAATPEAVEATKAEARELRRLKALGVITPLDHVKLKDERTMSRKAKAGVKLKSRKGSHGNVFVTKFDSDGKVVSQSITVLDQRQRVAGI